MIDIKNILNCVSVCYHRIYNIKDQTVPFPDDGLTLNKENFEKQILYYKKYYGVFDIKKYNNKKHSILITFDDGYKDLYEIVLPIIEKHDIPILIFITSSFVEKSTEFCWWIDLWYNLLKLDKIDFKIGSINKSFDIKKYDKKVEAYKFICSQLLKHNLIQIKNYFLINNFKTDYNKDFLTIEQLKILSNHKLVSIGYHSHYHLNYSVENLACIENDIRLLNNFFINNDILCINKLFAFCFGLKPNLLIQSIMFENFDYLFSLGLKEMLFNKNQRIISRVNISNKMSFINLRFMLFLFNKINYFK